jgi:hypothetical protein
VPKVRVANIQRLQQRLHAGGWIMLESRGRRPSVPVHVVARRAAVRLGAQGRNRTEAWAHLATLLPAGWEEQ